MSNYNVILCRACGAEVDLETWQCPYCPPGTPTTATDPVAGVEELVARAKPGIPEGQAPLAADPALAVSVDLADLLEQEPVAATDLADLPPEPEVVSIDDEEAAVLVGAPAPPPGLPVAPPLPAAPPPAAPGLPPGVPLAAPVPIPAPLPAPPTLAPPPFVPAPPVPPSHTSPVPVPPMVPPPASPVMVAPAALAEPTAPLAFEEEEEATEILDVVEVEEAPQVASGLAFAEELPEPPGSAPTPPSSPPPLAFEDDEPAFHVADAPPVPAAPPPGPAAAAEPAEESLAALFAASSAPAAPSAPGPRGRSRACPVCGTRLSASGACLICGSDAGDAPAAPGAPAPLASPAPAPAAAAEEVLGFADEEPPAAPASLPPMRSPLAAPASLPPMASPFAAVSSAPASLPPMASPLAATPAASEADRAFGLLLFEAEESLGRGLPERAVAGASRAVGERPDSLVARSLLDRARREVTRARRRERLEARLDLAEQRLEAGDLAAAEEIVSSALRAMPDHRLALSIFARLHQQRLQADTAEGAAGREQERLAKSRAERAVEQAGKALRAGSWRRALLLVRHALREHPGHEPLLALHAEALTALERQRAERARSRAQVAQVRSAELRIARGAPAEAVPLLEAVLADDPDNGRAWAALDDARRALAPRPIEVPTAVPPLQIEEAPAEVADVFVQGGGELLLDDGPPAPPPPPAPVAPPAPAAAPARPPSGSHPVPERPPSRPTPRPTPREPIPAVIRRPPPPRTSGLVPVLVIGALIVGGLAWLTLRGEPEVQRKPTVITPRTRITTPPSTLGPLAEMDPALRAAVEAALAGYARAFQIRDGGMLERVRPDLSEAERKTLLGLYTDAVSYRMELRVLEATARPDGADVVVLRTDVAVGGSARPGPPQEETWRFVQKDGVWGLRPAK